MKEKIALTDDALNNIWGGSQIPYYIRTGDTLGELANKFHCTIDDICHWNNIADPNKIWANQKLIFKFFQEKTH